MEEVEEGRGEKTFEGKRVIRGGERVRERGD